MDIWCQAIAERRVLSLMYDGLQRTVIPAAHGWHVSTSLESLRCYQVGGLSTSGRLPAWRMLTVEKLIDCVILDEHFDEVPSGYHLNDKHLGAIHCQL